MKTYNIGDRVTIQDSGEIDDLVGMRAKIVSAVNDAYWIELADGMRVKIHHESVRRRTMNHPCVPMSVMDALAESWSRVAKSGIVRVLPSVAGNASVLMVSDAFGVSSVTVRS